MKTIILGAGIGLTSLIAVAASLTASSTPGFAEQSTLDQKCRYGSYITGSGKRRCRKRPRPRPTAPSGGSHSG